ncbi:uncharacterized protein DS421_11g337840 [Arachis hypogaea]|nr:uncharacterized protein DS421_11g337840 [Arachis hypogaea]
MFALSLSEFSSNLILRFEFLAKSVEASPMPLPPELCWRHHYAKQKTDLLFLEFMFALLL